MHSPFLRRALYESVAESVPDPKFHDAIMALETAQRMAALAASGDDRAQKAVALAAGLASGKCNLEEAAAGAMALGFQPESIRDMAVAIKLRADGTGFAQTILAISDQIEAIPDSDVSGVDIGGVDIGWGFLKKVGRAAKKTTRFAHKITHEGPIGKMHTKVTDFVAKQLPITKPFIKFHDNVSGKLTHKLLAKTGMIPKPKGKKKTATPKVSVVPSSATRAKMAGVIARAPKVANMARLVPKAAKTKPKHAKPPGSTLKSKIVTAPSGRKFAVTIKAA